MSFLRSKVIVATSGVFVIGIVMVVIIALSSVKTINGPIAAVVTATTAANASPTTADTPDPSASDTPTNVPSGGKSPTATPTSAHATPTPPVTSSPTPRPTSPPTPTPAVGQAVDWIDVVGRVGSNSFTLRNRGTVVRVNGQTIYSGTVRSFSLMRVGIPVEVHGIVQSDGTLLATEVNANIDN
jgi:hypothetical protein